MSSPSHTPHIFDLTHDQLRQWCQSVGMPPFRARQIHEWVYSKGIADPALMSNLSKRDRELLADPDHGLAFLSGRTVAHQKASDGTQKLLIEWDERPPRISDLRPTSQTPASTTLPILPTAPGSTPHAPGPPQTECVMIPYGEEVFATMGKQAPDDVKERRTACISSQVGCPVGCRFCASGIGGLDGNLTAGRIVEQVWRLQQLPGVGRITNVVFMGMGEPLANFANVARAIRTLNTPPPHGLGISARKITVSTVGLPKAIEKLAAELDLPVTLALSLHAPNDTLRRELIPWAQYTTIPDLLSACQKWFEKTGREITLEYILLGGVNDRPEHARELARIARTLRANLNLIRYNEVAGMPFSRPEDAAVREFQRILRDSGVNTHIRASRGRDIAAACGQLRHEKSDSPLRARPAFSTP
ncbi:MAG: 23S rRNA (adenine(2503)-C(2))-methyltransferase RlmN [Phycisphaerales bacterium]